MVRCLATHDCDMAGQFASTALVNAAEGGHTATVEELLRLGADINARNGVRMRALHTCLLQPPARGAAATLCADERSQARPHGDRGGARAARCRQERNGHGTRPAPPYPACLGRVGDGGPQDGNSAVLLAVHNGHAAAAAELVRQGAEMAQLNDVCAWPFFFAA